MDNVKKKLTEMQAEIEQLRDEIKLKAHLGKKEAQEELEELEKKWKSLVIKCKPVTDELENTAENTGAALAIAADEIKAGYKKIRKLF